MISRLIRQVKTSTLLRYIIVGGTSYAIELTVILLLVHVLHFNTTLAVSVGFWLGLVISFLLQKFLAFKNTDTHARRLTIQTVYYALLVLFNYGFTLLFVHLLEPFIDLSIARTLALIITTAWNYVIYKKVIFTEIKR